MANLPEKIVQQRMKLQLESIESPSDLPGKKLFITDSAKKAVTGFQEKFLQNKFRLQLDSLDSPVQLTNFREVVSPMTDLAYNLCDTSLSSGQTPVIDIKKKLSMDYESSPSPSSSHGTSSDSGTPLSSITNKPKGRSGRTMVRSFTAPSHDFLESNKENIPVTIKYGLSPGKSPSKPIDSPLALKDRKSIFRKVVQSPETSTKPPIMNNKSLSQKRPLFQVMQEDENSRDSGYSSQPLFEERNRKKSRQEAESPSMADILANCSPTKEDGFAPLSASPSSKSSRSISDGFDLDSLETLPEMPEDEEDSEPSSFSSLLEKKILAPRNDNFFLQRASSNTSSPVKGKFAIRRAMSMVENSSPSCLTSESPISSKDFKRPEPPHHAGNCVMGRKKRSNVMVERSISLQYSGSSISRPSLQRSQSEIAIKLSCQMKDDVADALADSHGTYCLPSATGLSSNHPNLRSITCHTLADLIHGKHDQCVNSFRVIDVRYKFEYEGGHIEGAENWQHGEDEEFLSGILPEEPLAEAPLPDTNKTEKRNILIFHCEFSSQRAPDFYKKLRERDRILHANVYPALHYPEIYLLHLGYKEFYNNYPELCTGRYTEMVDPRYGNELRIMRAKSKSWSGGTVSRTGTMSRRFH